MLFSYVFILLPPNTETLKTYNPNPHVRIVMEFPFVIQRWNIMCCVWIGKHCVCIKVSIYSDIRSSSHIYTLLSQQRIRSVYKVEAVWWRRSKRKHPKQKEMETMWVRLGSYFCVIVWPEKKKKKENKLTLCWLHTVVVANEMMMTTMTIMSLALSHNNQNNNNNNNNSIMSTKRKLLNGKWILFMKHFSADI